MACVSACWCAQGAGLSVFTGDSMLFRTLGCQTDGHRMDLPPPHLAQSRAKVTFLMLSMLKIIIKVYCA